ncbi:MAG TPA: TAXI family TRAP transporter solute-binding subunit [Desulfuromonadales bacterium]|nr:TAXI family TRAP transporter solute-binding subunit [Desulfuromonadales bacterium]
MFRFFCLAFGIFMAVVVMFPLFGAAAENRISFSGGPEGGTFQYFSNGISSRLSKDLLGVDAYNRTSAGSVENIRRINSGEADFAIAYSGDTYLARNGLLKNDKNEYKDVLAVSYLYGAPAHLIVLDDSDIDSISNLSGKRIAVGAAGSGASAAACRFFKILGLWERMDVVYIGYSKAARALNNGQVDAMWAFAGFPNDSIMQAAASNKIKVLSTWQIGKEAGVFRQFPFYSPVVIPSGTYKGVDYEVKTFQDSALWVAGRHVSPDLVYKAVKTVFTQEGLAYMRKVKSTARAMSVDDALLGIVTPIHPGAARYWTEKNKTLSESQKDRQIP